MPENVFRRALRSVSRSSPSSSQDNTPAPQPRFLNQTSDLISNLKAENASVCQSRSQNDQSQDPCPALVDRNCSRTEGRSVSGPCVESAVQGCYISRHIGFYREVMAMRIAHFLHRTPKQGSKPVPEPSNHAHVSADTATTNITPDAGQPVIQNPEPTDIPCIPPESEGNVNKYDAYIAEYKRYKSSEAEMSPKEESHSKLRVTVEKTEDTLATTRSALSIIGRSKAASVQSAIDNMAFAQALRAGARSVGGALPTLMKQLHDIAKLHPYIRIAVSAFEASYKLANDVIQNNSMIYRLYQEMRSMIVVLLDLREVAVNEQSRCVAEDVVRGRLTTLSEDIANDIKHCGNSCDAYRKIRPVSKVFRAPFWVDKFAEYTTIFMRRREELNQAIGIHMVNKLANMDGRMGEMLAEMKQFCYRSMSPDELEIRKLMAQVPQDNQSSTDNMKLLMDKETLEKLLRLQGKIISDASKSQGHTAAGPQAQSFPLEGNTISELRRELERSPEAIIKKNFEDFSSRMDMKIGDLKEQLERVEHAIVASGDRIIEAIKDGPHVSIYDPIIRQIWSDMKWSSSVKARHLAMRLRDYYEELEAQHKHRDPKSDKSRSEMIDLWAIKWISGKKLLPMAEAIDNDSSGHVTINEVNQFTTSRPSAWSLPRRLAYWSLGWQAVACFYLEKIECILQILLGARHYVLQANRYQLDQFLIIVWLDTVMMTRGLSCEINLPSLWDLQAGFEDFRKEEEARLRANLEKVRFRIDDPDALKAVIGDGEIDKCIFPLVYILLQRAKSTVSKARHDILNPHELSGQGSNIECILDVMCKRRDSLADIFEDRDASTVQQMFRSASCGVFRYINSAGEELNSLFDAIFTENASLPIDRRTNEKYIGELESEHSMEDESQDVGGATTPNRSKQQAQKDMGNTSIAHLSDIIGDWYGCMTTDHHGTNDARTRMIALHFVHRGEGRVVISESSDDHGTLEEIFSDDLDAISMFTVIDSTTIEVETRLDDQENIVYILERTLTLRDHSWVPGFDVSETTLSRQTFRGHLSDTGDVLSGSWQMTFSHSSLEETETSGSFVFSKIPPRLYTLAPNFLSLSESITVTGKARSRWHFAYEAIRASLELPANRSKPFSWTLSKVQRGFRLRYCDLTFRERYHIGAQLSYDEKRQLSSVTPMLTTLDILTFDTLLRERYKSLPLHCCACDACDNSIRGARIICLDCKPCKSDSTYWFVDLCDNPACFHKTFPRPGKHVTEESHVPSHRSVKVREVVHIPEIPALMKCARAALEQAEKDFYKQQPENTPTNSPVESEERKHQSCDTEGAIKCTRCKEIVSIPCWRCATCTAPIYICQACESKVGFPARMSLDPYYRDYKVKGKAYPEHDTLHPLVWCQPPTPTAEEQFQALEREVKRNQNRIDSLEDSLKNGENSLKNMENSLRNVENLLERLVAGTVTDLVTA